MATMKLKADAREPQKKGGARRTRREGRIPGILYGQGKDSMPVSFDYSEFEGLLREREGMVIVEVEMAGQSPQQTIIRQIQRDPVSGRVLHLDLQHVSMTEAVQVDVPIHVVGIPAGVKTEGGILEHHLRTVLIKCLPTNIPPKIDVDVTELNIGNSVHVGDLPLASDDIEILTEAKVMIVSVIPPRIIKTDEPEGEEEAEVEGEAADEAAEGDEGKSAEGGKDADKESA